MAVREVDRGRVGPRTSSARSRPGAPPTPSRSSAGSMKKPNPSDTISTGMPAAWARRTNGTKPGSCGCAAAVASSASGSASTRAISQAISRREPMQPGVVRGRLGLPDAGTCSAMTCRSRRSARSCRRSREDRQRRRPSRERRDERAPGRARPVGIGVIRAGRRPAAVDATPSRVSATPATMIDAAEDLGRPDRLAQEDAASTTAIAGTSDWSAVTRVGPSSRTPLKTTTLARPAARIARVDDRERRSATPDRRRRSAPGAGAGRCRRAQHERPADVAQVVSTAASGAAAPAPRTPCRSPSTTAASEGQGTSRPSDARSADADAGRDDQDDAERTTRRRPTNFGGVSVSAPSATARSAVKTGVAAMSSAESPAGIDWSADRPQDLVAARTRAAEDQRSAAMSRRGSRIAPSRPAQEHEQRDRGQAVAQERERRPAAGSRSRP